MAAAVSTVSQNACTEMRGTGAMRSSRPATSVGPLCCQAACLAGFIIFMRRHHPPSSLNLATLASGYCVASVNAGGKRDDQHDDAEAPHFRLVSYAA
jgi:hypothetical protein